MRSAVVFLGFVVLCVLSGCSVGTSFVSGTGAGTQPSAAAAGAQAIRGMVHGGQFPVTGSVIQLWAPGTQGYGSTAGGLISPTAQATVGVALTDGNGSF